MREARLPLAYRDSCASLLIPLNRCRVDTYYMPWKCEVCVTTPPCPTDSLLPPGLPRWEKSTKEVLTVHAPQDERHSYEKCQYVEFKKRVAKMNELRAAKDGKRSN